MPKKTRKDFIKQIRIPEGVEVKIDGDVIIAKNGAVEVKKKVDSKIKISKENNVIFFKINNAKKSEKKILGTYAGHVKNMLEGLDKEFKYELEICNVHFPMTVEHKKAEGEIVIKNLLGEKSPRKLKVSDKVHIEINPPKIIIRSYDIELAGQTAASLEKVSRIRNRDRNKFQDGIFITKKPRKEF